MDGFFSAITSIVKAPVKLASKVVAAPFKAAAYVAPGPLKNVINAASAVYQAPFSTTNKVLNALSPSSPTASAKSPSSMFSSLTPSRGVAAPTMVDALAVRQRRERQFPESDKRGGGGRGGRGQGGGRGNNDSRGRRGRRGRDADGGVLSTVAAALNPSAPVAVTPQYIPPPSSPYPSFAPAPMGQPAASGAAWDTAPLTAEDYGLNPQDDNSYQPSDGGYEYGGDEEAADMGDIDYQAYFNEMHGLGDMAGVLDSLKTFGSTFGKGAASLALSTVANQLSPQPTAAQLAAQYAAQQKASAMSTPAKVAIGVAIAVPLLYLATRHRGSVAT